MTLHTKISFAKSAIRIVGFAFLLRPTVPHIIAGATLLIIAEAVSILEELVVE